MSRAFVDPTRSKSCAQCGQTFWRDRRNTLAYWGKAKFCGRRCAGVFNAARLRAIRLTLEQAFHARVHKGAECWRWTGSQDKDGYGILTYGKRTYRAPRLALRFDGRPVPTGKYACHHCDNPACVRPDHLYHGTPKQNSKDAATRDRAIRGERQHMAKLTEAAVREIRASRTPDLVLAQKFGVSRSAVSLARAGRTWGHVQ